MKRFWTLVLTLCLIVSCLPAAALAKAKQMEDDVPVWTEDTVKQYARDYIAQKDLERLRGYYDLQIRRYLPMRTYETMLTELAFMTGKFLDFGTYESFAEPEYKTKTHVLHLCMEKQDLDMYFTHKDKEDDWEIMALEFVPSQEQEPRDHSDMLVEEDEEPAYTEVPVTVGNAPYELKGILTLPAGASAENKVPACVLVHGSGPQDMDETIAENKPFADLARDFANSGIATLRYDKRTFTYGASMTPEEVAAITVEEETIQDAMMAGQLLAQNEAVDASRLVLVGHSMGAMLAPRIAKEADGLFTAMILIAGTPKSLAEIIVAQNEDVIAAMSEEQQAVYAPQLEQLRQQVEDLGKMTEEEARKTTFAGINAYYFWEMMRHDSIELIKKLKLPTYIVQGSDDFQVTPDNGVNAYEDALGDKLNFVEFNTYRSLNHLLIKFTGDSAVKGTIQEYNTPATVDASAARDLSAWILRLGKD